MESWLRERLVWFRIKNWDIYWVKWVNGKVKIEWIWMRVWSILSLTFRKTLLNLNRVFSKDLMELIMFSKVKKFRDLYNRIKFYRKTWNFSRNSVKNYRFNWRNKKKNIKVLPIYRKISNLLINQKKMNFNKILSTPFKLLINLENHYWTLIYYRNLLIIEKYWKLRKMMRVFLFNIPLMVSFYSRVIMKVGIYGIWNLIKRLNW
jgi:hypothetical protein